MKVHILDDWLNTLRSLKSFDKLAGHQVTVWNDHVEDLHVLAERLQEADCLVLFRERTHITAELLDRLPNLKLISQRSVYPHIDIEACTRNGVLVCSNMRAGGPSYAAAELTFALILASARQLPQQIASLKAGNWQMAPGQSLHGRRLGLYGYGRIGKQVAQYARAFGMKVWWWGSEEGRARLAADGQAMPETRESFFADSDFVSVHVRLKPSTRGLITSQDLLAMKPTASFINTSRSGLVEAGGLEAALATGKPGRIAVDVFDKEPLTDTQDLLLNHSNVIATPHIGFVTEDELDYQFGDIYDQIVAYAAGAPIHMVNAEVITSA